MEPSLKEAYYKDGVVLIKDALTPEELAKCEACFNWAIENPSPLGHWTFVGTPQQSYVDNGNVAAAPMYAELVKALPFGEILSELWGSEHVWYFAEEVFAKEGGGAPRTPWHQDTSYLPWAGDHWANAWISFESVPKKNALEVVRGSHHGMLHDGTTFKDPFDPTEPLHRSASMPQLPDIEKIRKIDPDAFDILSWATDPGDILFLHPGSLHGGAQVDADFPNRRTLVLRFFGDDATFRPMPSDSQAHGTSRNPEGTVYAEFVKHLRAGDPFRAPIFPQLK